jgi:hypothetical protein
VAEDRETRPDVLFERVDARSVTAAPTTSSC